MSTLFWSLAFTLVTFATRGASVNKQSTSSKTDVVMSLSFKTAPFAHFFPLFLCRGEKSIKILSYFTVSLRPLWNRFEPNVFCAKRQQA